MFCKKWNYEPQKKSLDEKCRNKNGWNCFAKFCIFTDLIYTLTLSPRYSAFVQANPGQSKPITKFNRFSFTGFHRYAAGRFVSLSERSSRRINTSFWILDSTEDVATGYKKSIDPWLAMCPAYVRSGQNRISRIIWVCPVWSMYCIDLKKKSDTRLVNSVVQ